MISEWLILWSPGRGPWERQSVLDSSLRRNQQTEFVDRNHRDGAHEDINQRHEEADCSDVNSPIPSRRVVHAPGRRKEVTVQAGDDDDEALKPHADIHDDAYQP